MKRKTITCDICGADMTNSITKFKFKSYDVRADGWKKCDICTSCYIALKNIIFKNKREREKAK